MKSVLLSLGGASLSTSSLQCLFFFSFPLLHWPGRAPKARGMGWVVDGRRDYGRRRRGVVEEKECVSCIAAD